MLIGDCIDAIIDVIVVATRVLLVFLGSACNNVIEQIWQLSKNPRKLMK